MDVIIASMSCARKNFHGCKVVFCQVPLRSRDPIEYLTYARCGVLADKEIERLGGGGMVDGDAHAVG